MSGDKVKGHGARVVQVPGYHLHPQYDLVHLRHLLDDRKSKKRSFHLNLAPMVDMFSILVIYLIMNFSSEGDVFFVAKDLTVPKATKGVALQSYPLISIFKNKVAFDAEKSGTNSPTYVEEENDGQNPQLRTMLRRMKELDIQISGKFKGQVNVQADEMLPVEQVKKVMRVLIDEGWIGINFVVNPAK